MKEEWFRGAAWDDEAKTLFEQKIARARDSKPYYLWIKARAIAPHHGADADALFERSLACGDHTETGRALYAWAEGLALRGEYDRALDMLARCSREYGLFSSFPMPWAKWDFALLAGVHRMQHRYREARRLLGLHVPSAAFGAQAGLAFMLYDRRRHRAARKHALLALERAVESGPAFPGLVDVPVTPVTDFPNPIIDRLLVIAGKWDEQELGPPPAIWPDKD